MDQQQAEKQISELKQGNSKLFVRVGELEAENKKIKEDTNNFLVVSKDQRESRDKTIAELESTNEGLETINKNLEIGISDLKEIIEVASKENNEIETRIEKLETENGNLKEIIEKGVDKALIQEIEEFKKDKEQYISNISKLQDRLKEVDETDLILLETENKKMKEQIENFPHNGFGERMIELEAENKQLKNRLRNPRGNNTPRGMGKGY